MYPHVDRWPFALVRPISHGTVFTARVLFGLGRVARRSHTTQNELPPSCARVIFSCPASVFYPVLVRGSGFLDQIFPCSFRLVFSELSSDVPVLPVTAKQTVQSVEVHSLYWAQHTERIRLLFFSGTSDGIWPIHCLERASRSHHSTPQ